MSRLERLAEMPAWPILMNAETGALYLEISQASFQALVRRIGVRPVDLGLGVVRWRRRDLDELVTGLPVRGAANPDQPTTPDFDTALARSAQRAGHARGQSRRPRP